MSAASGLVSAARNDSGVKLGGYGDRESVRALQHHEGMVRGAQIENLSDKNYELAYSYKTPRRSAFVTIGWQQP